MYMAPTIPAVNREMEAPMYIDLQIVRMTDGLSCFQAISLCSWEAMYLSSLFSIVLASVTFTCTHLDT